MADSGGAVRSAAWLGLIGLMVLGAAAGDAVAAERSVLGEYFTATW